MSEQTTTPSKEVKDYRLIKDGEIVNIIRASEEVLLSEPFAAMYDTYEEVIPPAPPVDHTASHAIVFSAPVSAKVNIEFTISVDIIDHAAEDALVPFTGSYFVPIKNETDGVSKDVLEVSFVGGHADAVLTLDSIGLWTFIRDQIRPVPQAKIEGLLDVMIVK